MSNEVSKASHEYYSQQVRTALGKSVEGFIEAGQWLAEAQGKLTTDGFRKLLDSLHMSKRSAERLKAISEAPAIATHVSHLPPHWGTLYELTRVPEDRLTKAIEAGELTPESDRKAVKKLVESTSKPAQQASGNGAGETQQASGGAVTTEAESGPSDASEDGSQAQNDDSGMVTTAPAGEGESNPVEPLEAVQADLWGLEKQCRSLVREIRQAMQFEGNEARRPYCGRYSKLAVIQPIEHVARTIKNEMPVDGDPDDPILYREQQAG